MKTDAEWQASLSPEQYQVCRMKGTERPFANKYYDHHEDGIYRCVACGLELFKSDAKFNSGTGWPSFFQPFAANVVQVEVDRSHGMVREEVTCAQCHSHLGHVFNDGPRPTGLRFCINSAALDFIPAKDTPPPAQ